MTQNIGTNGNKIPTIIPSLADNANIVEALTLYHYGAKTEPSPSLYLNSVAGQIDARFAKEATTYSGNLDSLITQGYYYVNNTVSGIPTYVNLNGTPSNTKYAGIVHVFGILSSNKIVQVYYISDTSSNTILQISYRNMLNNINNSPTWSDWKTISSTDHNHDNLYTQTTSMNTMFDTKFTQKLGYKNSTTDFPISTGNKKIIITAPNSAGTEPNIPGYTPQEGDLWFW
jgi:hypothetical protein